MNQEELYSSPGWEDCTFEGARRHALRMGLKTNFREKLKWLEQAEELGLRLQANRWKQGLSVDPRLRPALEAMHGPSLANGSSSGEKS